MNQPKIFTLLDFITFGLLSILAIAADIATWTSSDAPFEAKALMTAVSLAFAGIYIIIVWMRKSSIDYCDFITDGGWGVRNNSRAKITKEDVNFQIQKTKDMWNKALTWEPGIDAILNKNYMIVFEDNVGTDPCTGQRVAGSTLPIKFSAFDGKIIVYKMDELSLDNSALKHEVGHLIYFGKFGIWDNTMTHKFMSECKLP
jgi:hypothetical protein